MAKNAIGGGRTKTFSFEAFLSHRYKSSEINLYFFKLASEIAEIQFEVDKGTLSTNVTRLERAIARADAFIGIYPYPDSGSSALAREQLLKNSRYYRLELDLAVRSKKPALVFYDDAYRDLLECPREVLQYAFNSREILGAGRPRSAAVFGDGIRKFCDRVRASMDFRRLSEARRGTKVGLILPPHSKTTPGYTGHRLSLIQKAIEERSYTVVRFDWPPVLRQDLFIKLDELDWALVDLSAESTGNGFAAFLHGRFLPMMRIQRVEPGAVAIPTPLEQTLYGGVEVGYAKDTISWHDTTTLKKELTKRLDSIDAELRRFNTLAAAEDYFRSAAKRNELVFVSYSRKDQANADPLIDALRRRFHTVFDYRDGQSIEPGHSWREEISRSLAKAPIGLPLLSSNWLASRNCVDEADQMKIQENDSKMRLIPIKLYDEPLKLPLWLQPTQYIRYRSFKGAEGVAEEFVKWVSKEEKPGPVPPLASTA
jgi:hypothetical protein